MNSLTLLNFIYGYILYSKVDINISPSNLLIGFLYFISSTNFELYGISFKNEINLINKKQNITFYLEDYFDNKKNNIGIKCFNFSTILKFLKGIEKSINEISVKNKKSILLEFLALDDFLINRQKQHQYI